MTQLQVLILKELFAARDGLYPFVFFERHNITPSSLHKTYETLSKNQLIEEEEGKLYITKKGRNALIRKKIKLQVKDSKFDDLPANFLQEACSVNDFYLFGKISDISNILINLKKGN